MNILLNYPKFPDTFWSFSYALRFIGKKAAFPPLGLITVAALLPKLFQTTNRFHPEERHRISHGRHASSPSGNPVV